MTRYRVTYTEVAVASTSDLQCLIFAGSEEGARLVFEAHYSADFKFLDAYCVPGSIYSNNGRYSRYFKNNQQ